MTTNETYYPKRLTSQKQVRTAFWERYYGGKPYKFFGKSQNELPAGIRMVWVDFVDYLAREGEISERLANRVTL